MTAALLLLAVVLAAVGVASILRDPHGTAALRQALDDRAKELETYRESTMEMVGGFVTALKELSGRELDELRVTFGALTNDRERLVTALLAQTNPNAAALVARADEANARAVSRGPENLSEFLRDTLQDTLGERQRMATEFTDDRGAPITPVGLT